MHRKGDQEHWRPARRSFKEFNTRVHDGNWRITAHSQWIDVEMCNIIFQFGEGAPPVCRPPSFFGILGPSCTPALITAAWACFLNFCMSCDQVWQNSLLWQQKLHPQEDKREHDLFIYSFDFFSFYFSVAMLYESEAKANDDKYGGKKQQQKLFWVIKLHSVKILNAQYNTQ